MTKESLSSDRVNYLVWRYLLESDYKEAAVRLQKEWNIENPQELPFAPHVTNHALVSVLNKGLLYDACEQAFKINQGHGFVDQTSNPVTTRGIFGPILTSSVDNTPRDRDNIEDPELLRKHQLDEESNNHQIQHGPPGKKPRLSNGSNGYENGIGIGINTNTNGNSNGIGNGNGNLYETTPVPMDIDGDQNGDGHAYPSPEQLPSPIVITNGPERGTQIEKVLELGTETTYLDLLDDNPSSKSTILLHCEWNPRYRSILAAAGTDALARMWDLAHTVTDETNGVHPHASGTVVSHPACRSLLDPNYHPQTAVSALSWASNGSFVLVASEQPNGSAKIDAWSVDGQRVHEVAGMESPIISVKWNFSNTLYLSISPLTDGESGTKGAIFIVATMPVLVPGTMMMGPKTSHFLLPEYDLEEKPLEGIWTSDEDFIVCGGDMLVGYHFADGVITQSRKFETREEHQLIKIAFDPISRLLATGSQSGVIDIWDEQGQSRTFNAHTGQITSLIWQPIPSPMALNENTERLLASSSEDGAITIWNARSSEIKQKCSMTIGSSSVLALSFTPDGAFIAGATSDRVLIWKVEDTHIPRASWTRPLGRGCETPQSSDSVGEEDQHTLSWDAHGQRLAYGCNSVLAVINFSR